jgi:hypothetical protein
LPQRNIRYQSGRQQVPPVTGLMNSRRWADESGNVYWGMMSAASRWPLDEYRALDKKFDRRKKIKQRSICTI